MEIGSFNGNMLFGVMSLVWGIIVIWRPKILAYLVGIYFIMVGLAIILSNLAD